MKRLRILTLCTVMLSILIFVFKRRNPTTIASGNGLVLKKEWLATNKHPQTSPKDIRPADQTFLTFPEWYLVFSPEEQADYFRHQTATSFPFMAHIRQIWESYHIVDNQIKGNFVPNKGYHFMIWVIGSSATIEYSIKAWYETVVGRLTDTKIPASGEDKFNAAFTKRYVDFIKIYPWYQFDFKNQLKKLWSESNSTNGHFVRSIERKYWLTSELLIKMAYGKLIKMGTQQIYDEALPNTVVVLDDANLTNKNTAYDGKAIVSVPRYDSFNMAANKLAMEGYGFKEIAGNNSAILLTILVPANFTKSYVNAKEIFNQPIASDLSKKRIAIATPVTNLSSLLVQLNRDKIKVEHIFDY